MVAHLPEAVLIQVAIPRWDPHGGARVKKIQGKPFLLLWRRDQNRFRGEGVASFRANEREQA